MPSQKLPLAQRVAEHYSVLLSASHDLNHISDELGNYISELDSALKKLNLGVAVWVPVHIIQNPGELEFENEDLGYSKANGRWGICLRKISGSENVPDVEWLEEVWLFNEAPRRLRIDSIDHIPELIETLSKEAVKTTTMLSAKLGDVRAVADAVKSATNARTTTPKRDLRVLRESIIFALEMAGHKSASQLLSNSMWTLKEDGIICIEVPGIGKKMLALTVNSVAEQVIKAEFRRLQVPSRFIVVPVEATGKATETSVDSSEKGGK